MVQERGGFLEQCQGGTHTDKEMRGPSASKQVYVVGVYGHFLVVPFIVFIYLFAVKLKAR